MTAATRIIILGGRGLPSAPGLAAWYRADRGVTVATGVSQWDDQSGNARHLLQATAVSQPVFSASAGPNGLPALTFDGSNDSMEANMALTQPTTIYAIFKQVTWIAGRTLLDGDPVNAIRVLQTNAGVTPQIEITAGATACNNGNAPVGVWVSGCFLFSGAASLTRINNTAEATGNAGTASATSLVLGADGGGFGDFGNVAFSEVLVYNAAHDPTTRAAIISYLMRRAGL